MAPPSSLEAVQLSLILLSTPVYLWFLATIIRFRNKSPFCSSFFTLCLGLAVADFQSLIFSWLLGKFSRFGWLGIDSLIMRYNSVMAKMYVSICIHAILMQFTAVAFIAFNRCTALAFFRLHKAIWSKKFVFAAVSSQLFLPLIVLLPAIITQPCFYPVDNFTGEIGTVNWVNSDWQASYMAGILVYIWVINVVAMAMYGLAFYRVRKASLNVGSAERGDIRLAVIGASLTILMSIYGWIMYKLLVATSDPDSWSFYINLWSVLNDVFSWSNPWICFGVSPTIRKHMIDLISGKADLLSPETRSRTVSRAFRRSDIDSEQMPMQDRPAYYSYEQMNITTRI